MKVIAACRTKSKLPTWFNGEVLEGDLQDGSYTNMLTDHADVICHTAAWAEFNGTLEDSNRYFLKPTLKLIDASLKNGVKRFIFLSSIASNPILENRIHSKKELKEIWPHYYNILKLEKYLEEISKQGIEVVILRAGYFTGKNYSLGILPILLPRLKTHLVPWIDKGKTTLPLIDGKDLGKAFLLSSLKELKNKFNTYDIVGKEIPTVEDVLKYLHRKYKFPFPHFNISFEFAYMFAFLMKRIFKVLPGDPLIVPPIVLLLEETNSNNNKAEKELGYEPEIHWKESIDVQIEEMKTKQTTKMKMNKG